MSESQRNSRILIACVAIVSLFLPSTLISRTFDAGKELPEPFSRLGPSQSGSNRAEKDGLAGEWQVRCTTKVYRDGQLYRSTRDKEPSLVVAEGDMDGSYYLYRFPDGFGEAFPRIRQAGPREYAGSDTIKGIAYTVKQNVTLERGTITIKQSVFDSARNQLISETTCAGTRSSSATAFRSAHSTPETCSAKLAPGPMPGKELTRRYKAARAFSFGMAAVASIPAGSRALKWGFIDEKGRVVIEPNYDVVSPFNTNLAAAGRFVGRGRNIKWGIVENLGPQVTPHLNYDSVKILGEGFAAVGYVVPGETGLRWNLINRENTTVIHGLGGIECFVNGQARAYYIDGKVLRDGHVDKAGNFVSNK